VLEIQGMRPDVGIEDSLVWKDGEFLRYLVNSSYVVLRKGVEGGNKYFFLQVWRCKALPSAQVTAWRVLSNKITIRTNLEMCGVVVESLLCSLWG